MERKIINPWSWQDAFGFVQANEISGAKKYLFCAGQTSVDSEGTPLHANNMEAQITQAFDNLETILEQAGMTLTNVVQMKYYVTDINAFASAGHITGERLAGADCKPATSLLGVNALFHPDIVFEVEAIAAV